MSEKNLDPVDEAPAGADAPARVRYPKLLILATVFGVMMDGIDATALAVANPSIAADLNTTLPGLQWVTVGYLLAQTALLIVAGRVSDGFGHKRVFLSGLVGFALASVVVGLSVSVPMMVASRVVQGVFGSVLICSSLAILRVVFPTDQLKRAVAIWGGALALAGAAGPFVSGVVVNYLGWRWVFFLNLLVAGIAVAVGGALIPKIAPSRRRDGFDLPGVVLLAVALGSLTWSIIRAPETGWASAGFLAPLAIAMLFLGLFLRREGRVGSPLLPLSLFRVRALSVSSAVLLFSTLTLTGTLFLLGLYLQQVRGLSALEAGITLVPALALFSVGAPAGASLNEKRGPRPPIVIGLAVVAVALLGLSATGTATSVHLIWPFLALLGLGIGMVNPTATVVVMSAAPMRFAGVASGLQQTAGMLGSTLSTSVLGMVLALRVGAVLPDRLAEAGVSGDVAGGLTEDTGKVAQGVVDVPSGTSAEQARAAADAGHQAFVDGLGTALLAGAGVAVATAVFAAFLVVPPPSAAQAESDGAMAGAPTGDGDAPTGDGHAERA